MAQLVYEDASGCRISLCLASAPTATGPELEVVNLEGLTAGNWHEGELTYALRGAGYRAAAGHARDGEPEHRL